MCSFVMLQQKDYDNLDILVKAGVNWKDIIANGLLCDILVLSIAYVLHSLDGVPICRLFFRHTLL